MGAVSVKAEALVQRLAGLGRPSGLPLARELAMARLATLGLPSKRDEYWRYTDPTVLNGATVKPAPKAAPDDDGLFGALDAVKLVFVDGVFDAAASDDMALAGVTLSRLTDVNAPQWAQGAYGALEAAGQSPVARPWAALNTAFANEGLLIHVTGKAQKPLSLTYLRKDDCADVLMHHVIKLDAGADLTVLEQGCAGARFNQVIEVDLGPGARFHHIRSQGRDPGRLAATHIFAHLAAGALFKSFTLTAEGAITRNEAVITFAGPDAKAHIAGAALGDGDFHHDDTVFVTHGAERCESRQVFKKVLKHGAVGVFQGKILVKKGAQKTDGYQISQALLLDDASQFLAKPELEIYADDVKCSHGSTSGAMDDAALFYLRSRGVPLRAAQSLLILAFLADTIAEIEDETIGEDIRNRLEIWLARQES